jgi:hypothetical protein
VHHARKSRLVVTAAVALAACAPTPQNAADTSNAAASASDAKASAPASTPTPAPANEPWRYGPTLAAAVPPGLAASPVLELAEGLQGRGRFVVAVAGADAPARLEVWTFSQFNEGDRLERVGPPELLLDLGRLEAGMPGELVAGLRRDIASPGNESVRAQGLPGEPVAVLAELARLAAAATGPGEPALRARSLAEFTRGLDERLMWERLPGLLQRLRSGPWSVGEPSPLGARRVRFSAREGDKTVTLELTRMQERWMLSEVVEG